MVAKRLATGRIVVVQEQRFRLRSDAGSWLLLTLAHDAPLDAADLCRLRDAGARGEVEYGGEPGLAAGVARGVRTL